MKRSISLAMVLMLSVWATTPSRAAPNRKMGPAGGLYEAVQNWAKATRLAEILRECERVEKAESEAHCSYTRTEEDNTFNKRKVYSGVAWSKNRDFIRADEGLEGKRKPVLLIRGDEIRLYKHDTKSVLVFKSSGWPFLTQTLTAMYAGTVQSELLKQYEVSLVEEDKNSIYLNYLPRSKMDRATCSRARVVLDRDTYRIRQLWYEQPNGSTITWDFMWLKPDSAITWKELSKDLPKGYEETRLPSWISECK